MKLLFATQNQNKVREVRQVLGAIDALDLIFPFDLKEVNDLDPEETGSTFKENALIKAKSFSDKTGLICVADDSGLMVTALDGAPGVKSKRFIAGTSEDRNQEILKLLTNKTDRSAMFVSIFAIYNPKNKEVLYLRGQVDGQITNEAQGEIGFGYDPIFQPNGFNKTFAQMSSDQKNQISHRGKALQKLKTYILNKI